VDLAEMRRAHIPGFQSSKWPCLPRAEDIKARAGFAAGIKSATARS